MAPKKKAARQPPKESVSSLRDRLTDCQIELMQTREQLANETNRARRFEASTAALQEALAIAKFGQPLTAGDFEPIPF